MFPRSRFLNALVYRSFQNAQLQLAAVIGFPLVIWSRDLSGCSSRNGSPAAFVSLGVRVSRELPPNRCRGIMAVQVVHLASSWVPLCRRLCFYSWMDNTNTPPLHHRTTFLNPYTLFGLLLRVFRADLAHFWAQLKQCGENFHNPWCWLTFGGSKDCQRKVRNLLHYHHPQPFLPHIGLYFLWHTWGQLIAWRRFALFFQFKAYVKLLRFFLDLSYKS